MHRLLIASFGAAAALGLGGAAQAADYAWTPEQPVTIIVPWAAGGSTDQVTRLVAGELEEALGQSFVIVNQPGASGSVGTKNAWDAPHDGMTWAAGAAQDLGTYPVLGMLDQTLDDWRLYLDVANVSVIGVNPDAPWQDFGQLLEDFRQRGSEISVATAGLSSAGHNAMEALAQQTGIEYKHVTYDGGNPAVIATVAGETEVTTQLASEQAEMIRGGRLRPLAVLGAEPLELAGLRHDPFGHRLGPGTLVRDQLLRHLGAQGRAGRGVRDHGSALGGQDRELRGAQGVRHRPRRAVHAVLRRGGAGARDGHGAAERLAALRRRQGGEVARRVRHRAAVSGAVRARPRGAPGRRLRR